MSVYKDIRAALEKTLASDTTLPAIAYENTPFSPTTGTPFIVCRFYPVDRRSAIKGVNPVQLYTGFFSVWCYCPEDEGPSAADTVADKVFTLFPPTSDISHDGTFVTIDRANRGYARSESPFYYVPIDIHWYTYAR